MALDLFTFGETMLRLNPAGGGRLELANMLEVHPGGAESNVAANVARLGKKSAWFSRLPDTPVGAIILNALRMHGVDISAVKLVPDSRQGVYFVEAGEAPRGIRVWYDRAHSAASHMTPEDLPLEMMRESRWIHATGITPALSASCAATVHRALHFAREHGIRTSLDVNYRALLWSAEAAAAALDPLCHLADTVTIALRDAVNLFHAPDSLEDALRALQGRWGGTVIITQGEWGVGAYNGAHITTVHALNVSRIVDRLGAGDALSSGVICRLLEGADIESALHFGTAMSALKLTIPGDIAIVTRAEVDALVAGGAAGLSR